MEPETYVFDAAAKYWFKLGMIRGAVLFSVVFYIVFTVLIRLVNYRPVPVFLYKNMDPPVAGPLDKPVPAQTNAVVEAPQTE